MSILSLCSTVICESHTRIGSRNLKDNKFLTTTGELIILHGGGGLSNPCLFSLSLTPLGIYIGWFYIIPSGFREIFRRCAVPRFHLLGFGVIFRRSAVPAFRIWDHIPPIRDSAIPPFHHSTVPSLRPPCAGSDRSGYKTKKKRALLFCARKIFIIIYRTYYTVIKHSRHKVSVTKDLRVLLSPAPGLSRKRTNL